MLAALKPADWIVLTFFVMTFPMVAFEKEWSAVLWRAFMVPTLVGGRFLLANQSPTPPDRWPQRLLGLALLFGLDVLPLLSCIYVYGEDGASIKALWPMPEKYFWDKVLKHADAELFDVPVEQGVGAYLRSLTPPSFNRMFGEYLHFAYFFFYIILAGTYLMAWVFCAREHFDRVAAAENLTYVVCLSWYLFMPAAGPYWSYPDKRPAPEDVGYFFSYLTHAVVEGGSSSGTAFPSGHCAITTTAFICSFIYMWPLGVAYIFVAPALVLATVWGGFHYFMDAAVGVSVGALCAALGILFARLLAYNLPARDEAYTEQFRWSRDKQAVPLLDNGARYMHLPDDDVWDTGAECKR